MPQLVPESIYDALATATPEQRVDIILSCIENDPEGELYLPAWYGKQAILTDINLDVTVIRRRYRSWMAAQPTGSIPPPWWNSETRSMRLVGANLKSAKLSGAVLISVNLQDAELDNADLSRADLTDARLEKARLNGCNLEEADLTAAVLDGTNLSDARLRAVNLTRVGRLKDISFSGAWFERNGHWLEKLEGRLGEEQRGDFRAAWRGYVALKQYFNEVGDYNAGRWAHKRERHMERAQAWLEAKTSFIGRRYGHSAFQLFRVIKDIAAEYLCDYGEGFWHVILWMFLLLVIVGPFVFDGTGSGGLTWAGEESQKQFLSLSDGLEKWKYVYFQDLLYTLDTFTTGNFSERVPADDFVRLASGCMALVGIFLAGLLGFVAGNRIRRS